MNKANINIIPKIGSDEARQKHETEPWTMFARRFQRHPYVKAFILERDSFQCSWCKRPVKPENNFQIHHIDYDHHCEFHGRVELPTPTVKRPNKMFRGPDCKSCRDKMYEVFLSCASRVTLVHGTCNSEIENARLSGINQQK